MKQGSQAGATSNNVQPAAEDETSACQGMARPDTHTGRVNWKRMAAVLGMAIAIPLVAQQTRVYQDGNSWVEEITGTMPSSRELRVNMDLGSVEAQGNVSRFTYRVRKRSYARTEVEARKQFQQMRITAAPVGEASVLEGRLATGSISRFNAEVMLEVPGELQMVRLESGTGSITAKSLGSTLIAKTGGGAVKLDDIAGPAVVKSGGGDITVGSVASELSISAGGGAIRIDKVAGATKVKIGGGNVWIGYTRGATIDTGAGSIEVQKCAGDLVARTGGGNLNFGDIGGAVHVDAGGGSVRLGSAKARVEVTTGGGNVELHRLSQNAQVDTGVGSISAEFVGGPGTFADSSLHTAAGDIEVFLPGNLPVTVHASSDVAAGYGIKTDFSDLKITREGGTYGPQSVWAEGTLNGGGPLLRIRTTIGKINFHRSH